MACNVGQPSGRIVAALAQIKGSWAWDGMTTRHESDHLVSTCVHDVSFRGARSFDEALECCCRKK